MPIQDSPDHYTLHLSLASKPDTHKIPNSEFQNVPRLYLPSKVVDTPRDLKKALERLNETLLLRGIKLISYDRIQDQVGHEEEHDHAARIASFKVVKFVLAVEEQGRRLTGWQTGIIHLKPGRPITKLAFASITAAPKKLSDGDKKALEIMGYRDTSDVADRIADHNKSNRHKLTVPLSVL